MSGFIPRDILHIGRITSPHGINGELRVHCLSEAAERFRGLSHCLLVSPDEKNSREIRISRIRESGKMLLFALDGFDTREKAETLRGWFLSVTRDESIPLEPGQFFIVDLIGCAVIDREHGQLGTVKDILQTGANDVYLVQRLGKKDLLVPVLRKVVESIDMDSREIHVILPEGLLEIYD